MRETVNWGVLGSEALRAGVKDGFVWGISREDERNWDPFPKE